MLDSDMSAQLQNYMGLLRRPFTINASLGDDAKSGEMRDLLQQIAGMSDKITLQLDGKYNIPISRNYQSSVHKAFIRYMTGM